MTNRKMILHLTGDFPDPIEPFKTQVIRQLVDLTERQFEHHVVSINRVEPSPTQLVAEAIARSPLHVESDDFEYGTALRYFAYGRGLFHKRKLEQLGDWLAHYIEQMPRRPDLIIGHKLAIEGLAVRRAAMALKLPYGLSIQGDSDTKVMDVRRDLTPDLREVLNSADVIFPFAPWAWDRVTSRLGTPAGRCVMLPCPTDIDQPLAPTPQGNGLISVFHLASYKRKNLGMMARAIDLLGPDGCAPRLDVIGGGTGEQTATCERIVQNSPSIKLLGAKDRSDVRAAMNAAKAFILPSRRETFGLVFIEALFAGLPIIYPRGTAVDGYFDDAPFAIAVDAKDPRSIATAIKTTCLREAELKAELLEWQNSDHAARFQRARIADDFAAGLTHAARIAC